MATKKKLLQAAAGSAGAGGLNIEDVFSTYLYTSTGATLAINNGIDLAGEGGLVWIKRRSNVASHVLVDTERGDDKYLKSDSTSGEATRATMLSFSSTGFSLDDGFSVTNGSGGDFASWTWRQAPKFFDVLTYTGNGTTQNISHNLGSVPGMIIIKCTSRSGDFWSVYHRSIGNNQRLLLQSTNNAGSAADAFNSTDPTSTQFSVGQESDTNASGQTYVAYLFAHNNSDGEFGPTSDQDIIKCDSYTGNGTFEGGPEINLGFEPQWVMLKNTSASSEWFIYDSMRGITDDSSNTKYLQPNRDYAENSTEGIELRPTGFQVMGNNVGENTNGNTYIYIAIRRGPMAVPESATDVFAMDDRSGGPPNAVSGFPVDMAIFTNKTVTDNKYTGARLIQGKRLFTNLTSAEGSSSELAFDYSTGFIDRSDTSTDNIHWMWRRAPNFCDIVCYEGNGVEGRTVSHNLGVVPEMMWVKRRDATSDWGVYTATTGNNQILKLNTSDPVLSPYNWWNYTTPTNSVFTLGGGGGTNISGGAYIAYLFASLDGVSKVGSFSHTSGSDTDVNCNFSGGARFVLIKNTDSGGHWITLDTERGIVAGNDPWLRLNSTSIENTSYDVIDPLSSGFTVPGAGTLITTGSYIFYAIA
jgi:hypothetical protein